MQVRPYNTLLLLRLLTGSLLQNALYIKGVRLSEQCSLHPSTGRVPSVAQSLWAVLQALASPGWNGSAVAHRS